ncbi:hypothetical protein FC756_22880 [Lysinibacillus mangiferihumi]|uniref:CHAT domain-containing protein n=1 Tax=Lysinibacillus mangiferihumi TaxID=1130819 RepID=A0A4U2XZY8_9BACI|nr:hypothetical protein [Lysinibacillus mangiferihumi]TKI53597.1 hypothetical protein FC756_22880 [Lysinibacillus mangiferihumi]
MVEIPVDYRYIRTNEELQVMIKQFEKSKFKYLHLSCHGNANGIAMTLNNTYPFKEFKDMFTVKGLKKRLFLSSCSVCGENIKVGMHGSDFISIVGPKSDIEFDDAAIFWAAFYQQMFKFENNILENDKMYEIINKMSSVLEVKMACILRNKETKKYYEKTIKNI